MAYVLRILYEGYDYYFREVKGIDLKFIKFKVQINHNVKIYSR